jgi:SpoVK/Ycf46/Vps4 family AAA+-type ATPase
VENIVGRTKGADNMEHLREVSKIAEWGIRGDTQRLTAYLNQLIEKLENSGDKASADRLRNVLIQPTATVQPSSLGGAPRLPVDTESRLSLADEEFLQEKDVPVILNSKVKQRVHDFINYVQTADALERHGVGIAPSLITYGPPGTGKTQLARYIASQLKRPLITARADTLISSFLGSTSKNLRTLFDHIAHRHCILFLDEIDAFAKLRDDQQELGELKRVVVSLLQNIDTMNPHTILLAATNHEHLLDPAIWRRFEFKIPLPLPEKEEREQLFKLFMGALSKNHDLDLLAELAEQMTGSDIKTLTQDAIRNSIVNKKKTLDEKRLIWQMIELRLGRNLSPAAATPEDICAVRDLSQQHFKYALLAELFETSEATISRKIKKGATNE